MRLPTVDRTKCVVKLVKIFLIVFSDVFWELLTTDCHCHCYGMLDRVGQMSKYLGYFTVKSQGRLGWYQHF